MMEAAAIDNERASPLTISSVLQDRRGSWLPSMRQVLGAIDKFSTARRMARRLACKILSWSISSTLASPTPTVAISRISGASASRRFSESILESARPSGMAFGSRITAAAITGPASGPRPASSTPATMPPAASSRSNVACSLMPALFARVGERARHQLFSSRSRCVTPNTKGIIINPFRSISTCTMMGIHKLPEAR